MRPSTLGLLGTLLVIPTLAEAGPTGGGGGGSGRLGQVTSGIDSAASSGEGNGGGSSTGSHDAPDYEGELYRRRSDGQDVVVVARDGTIVRRIPRGSTAKVTAGPARVDLFVGIQKVIDSDRSYALSLAVEDKWFRVSGAVNEYREQQMDGTKTALTLPTLMLGARVLGGGPTRGFLEAGAAIARTRENGMTGSNLTGPIVGVHLEHAFRGPTLIGDLHAMAFDAGIKAYSGRIGLRAGHFEAAFRVLDFNVGPALYGPEVGLQF